MEQQLFLAANLVPQTIIYGHLQIVHADAEGRLSEAEATSPGFPYFFGDWAFPAFGRPHDSPSNTPGYGDPDTYARTPLPLQPGQTALHAWELLGQIHASLASGDHGVDYDIDQNSNSYVGSVLSVLGIDLRDHAPALETGDIRGFPGLGTNIFEGAKTGGLFSGRDTAIALTLSGTAGDDIIMAGIGDDRLGGAAGRDRIAAGRGDDVVHGGRQSDRLSGGAGDDVLQGAAGADRLFGETGADSLYGGRGRDLLEGGDGDDLLWGRKGRDELSGGNGADRIEGGTGNDMLSGGAGADIFAFAGDFDHDVIADFEAGGLDRIDLGGVAGITGFAQLLAAEGPRMFQRDADVVIDDLAGNTIRIAQTALEGLTAADFVF